MPLDRYPYMENNLKNNGDDGDYVTHTEFNDFLEIYNTDINGIKTISVREFDDSVLSYRTDKISVNNITVIEKMIADNISIASVRITAIVNEQILSGESINIGLLDNDIFLRPHGHLISASTWETGNINAISNGHLVLTRILSDLDTETEIELYFIGI